MLPASHVLCCLLCTLAILVGAAPSPTPVPEANRPLVTPAAASVIEAHHQARRWLDEFSMPAMDASESRREIPGCRAVCVILRQSGRVVGVGEDAAGDDLMLRRAAGRALGEVLSRPALAGMTEQERELIGRELTLEIEAAGEPQPLIGSNFTEVSASLEPGLDGLALRRHDSWAFRFPARLRSTDAADVVERGWIGLVSELDVTAGELEWLGRSRTIGAYRFRTVHVAQSRAAAPPFVTVRGDQVVSDSRFDRAALGQAADDLARHLLQTLWPGPEPLGLMGAYQPVGDRHEPVLASSAEQGLASLALCMYSQSPGVDQDVSAQTAQAAATLLSHLAQRTDGEADPLANLDACAALILAAAQPMKQLNDPAVHGLTKSAVDELLKRTLAMAGAPTGATPHSRALRAAALARALRKGWLSDKENSSKVVRDAIDAAWGACSEPEQVSLLPWIGWAEIDLADAKADGRGPVANGRRFFEMRELLHSAQITSMMPEAAPDLLGGFWLRGAGSSRVPLANSQSARPAAWLALALADVRFTQASERGRCLVAVMRSMRFLRQLQIRPESTWTCRNPQRALGGLRNATWDSPMPPAAQALGLIAFSQTLQSMD